MHFVLVMDSDHPDFVRRCIENPFVVKECSVVWYSSWNADTLLQVYSLISVFKSIIITWFYLDSVSYTRKKWFG